MNKIHPSADVQTQNVGKGTQVWQNSIILKGAVIGKDCNINCQVFIENDVIIGDNVTIKPGVQIWDGLRIANDVFIGPNVTFTNDLVPRSKQYPKVFEKTIIERGSSIGANATIISGNTIGEYAMIGAGSLVTKNIPSFTLWYGNPAMHKGYITKQGKIIGMDLKDKDGCNYILVNNEPIIQ
ncbi:MAG: N-acetyltransferase [Bacteroidales bacterium]|nr:N-acetyltransferase [Bacteroidales bacterium]